MTQEQPEQKTPILITQSAELAALCARLASERFITVDTEFMRERTYYPQLCLVQVAGAHEGAAIDALVKDLDWTPFWDLMRNPQVLKVFHAPRQDIEIFLHKADVLPAPMFDTQVAAMACGFPDQVSYAKLAEATTGTFINKEEQYTDWTARPLRASQIEYALQDVIVLHKVYEVLEQKLGKNGRYEWIAEEMQRLQEPGYYRVDPATVWEKLRLRSNKPASWAALQLLADWREREAMRINRPRQMILKDEVLTQLAMALPGTIEQLAKTRGLPNNLGTGVNAETILRLVQQARGATKDTMPRPEKGPALTGMQEDQLDLLKLALRILARQEGLSPKLLASSEDLEQFVLNPEGDGRLRHGWRAEMVGQKLHDLWAGQSSLRMHDGRLGLIKDE